MPDSDFMKFKGEKNMENLISPEKEMLKVDKIHLLIHPGFLTYHLERENMPEAEQYSPLLDMYIAKAEAVAQTPNEIMVVFVPRTRANIKIDIAKGRKNLVKLQTIKKILGRRAIFISEDNSLISGDAHSVIKLVKQIARVRGFQIEDTVASEAYGEWFAACVTDGSVKLNQAAGWKAKTVLRPELTDLAVSSNPQEELEGYLSQVDSNFVGHLQATNFVETTIPSTWD